MQEGSDIFKKLNSMSKKETIAKCITLSKKTFERTLSLEKQTNVRFSKIIELALIEFFNKLDNK